MMESEIERVRDLCGTPAELLVTIYRLVSNGESEIPLSTLRRSLGSKVYANAYKLSALGLLTITNNRVKLTEKGYRLAECLYECFSSDSDSQIER